jgi:hypothetical protein
MDGSCECIEQPTADSLQAADLQLVLDKELTTHYLKKKRSYCFSRRTASMKLVKRK